MSSLIPRMATESKNFLGRFSDYGGHAGLPCHIRFSWDSPTHYRGPMAGICRVY